MCVRKNVIGDILLIQTRKGHAYMQIERIANFAGKDAIRKQEKVISNITASK